jgi:membrane-associated phospholipid phosphatase
MTDNETVRDAAKISRRWPLISSAVAVLLVAGLGGLIFLRGNLPSEADAEWMEEILEHRNPLWEAPALLMDHIGGGLIGVFVVPLLIIAALCFYRRFVSALYFLIATVVSAGLVQLLKNLYVRPRPEDILVVSDVGSFPSGHSANAATMAVVLGFIIRRLWVWVAGIIYTVAMVLSRTYLGAHWITDTIGGVVLGAAVAVIVWAPFAYRLHLERKNPPRALFGGRRKPVLPR